MKCSKCGAENRAGARFCDACGVALVETSFKSAPSATGAVDVRVNLQGVAPELPEGERKTITALFADIKSSTELMRELDPEEARAIIDPVLQLMMDAVHRYDGYVAQSTGDGIFAMFGAPVAHEDHPQRALHAALTIQQELRKHGEQLAGQEGHGLKPVPVEARIGVNTGEVVLRIVNTGGHTEYSPVGHVANLAARMQTVAPAGSIVITEESRRLVEGYFSLRVLGPTEIKGISEPVNVYEVIGASQLRGHFDLAAQRGLTRFVGREHELAELQRALDLTIGGRGQIVAVVADAGTGKSRLFYEFKAKLSAACELLEAYSVSHGKSSAWLPVLDLLRGYFGIQDADDLASRRSKVRGKLMALDLTLSEIAPYLLGVLGIQEDPDPLGQMDVPIRRQRTLEAIKQVILRESLEHPLVVIFEDLHWIDQETQALLDLLTDWVSNARILLLVNYRPEYHHEWGNKSCYSQLRLDALDQWSAEQMVAPLLSDNAELSPLKRLIIERTGGNPFFIEEMVQALFDDGTLARNGAVRMVHPLSQLRLPPTVQGILASRMDRLSAGHKQLLQTLAVIGRESPLTLIQQLSSDSQALLDTMLAHLQTAEFVFEQAGPAGAEYVFKHALTQEVAYNSVLMARRKLLHERAGQAIESIFANYVDDHLNELAYHYGHTDNISKAVEYLARVGQQYTQRSAYGDAIRSFDSALQLVQKLPESRERIQQEIMLQQALGSASIAVKGWAAPEVERAFTRARKLSEPLGNPPELFAALFGLFSMYFLRGELGFAHELAVELLRRAEVVSSPVLIMYAHVALGDTSYAMGEFVRAREHLERAVSLYDRERHAALTYRFGVDAGINSLSYLGQTLHFLGYPELGFKRSAEALSLAQGMSNPHSLAFAENFVSCIRLYRREPDAAQQVAEELIALAVKQGASLWLSHATVIRGCAFAMRGHGEEGITQVQEGLAAYRATRTELGLPEFLCVLAEALTQADRLDEGLAALAEAQSTADRHQEHNWDAEINRVKGELLLKQRERNAAEAHTCFERAIEVARKQQAKFWELRATMSLAKLLARHDRQEARTMLAGTYNWFTEGFDTADLKEAKALLDELSA